VLAIETEGLSKHYGHRVAVNSLDLQLPSGHICGFVGPNGAGKTTTLRMLLGLIAPSAGSGQVLGQSLDQPQRYLDRVGALIEAPAFYPKLSGQQNLQVLARLAGLPAQRIAEVLDVVRLNGREGDRYRSYSLGMKQRLGLAAALLPDPELLILDEPTNGMDPAGIREMRQLLRQLADAGKTVLVSSHLLAEIEAICDELVLITHGSVRFQGPIAQLRQERGQVRVRCVPEQPVDLERLDQLISGQYTTSRDEQTLVVVAPAGSGATINRLAFAAGIVLAAISEPQASLEEMYFALTADSEVGEL
jgi:ABC-2 type transport system ATP-binding protein